MITVIRGGKRPKGIRNIFANKVVVNLWRSFTLLVSATLLYILRDGEQTSFSSTAVKTVKFLVSLQFVDRLRFTLSNRDRTRSYKKFLLQKAGMHNSNLMAGQNFFVVMFKGQNLYVFTFLKDVFTE
jgi:hypothetical protein